MLYILPKFFICIFFISPALYIFPTRFVSKPIKNSENQSCQKETKINVFYLSLCYLSIFDWLKRKSTENIESKARNMPKGELSRR